MIHMGMDINNGKIQPYVLSMSIYTLFMIISSNMNTELKKSGNNILYEKGLLDILSSAGEPKIVGSYDLNLLINPDIDITVGVDKYDTDRYFDICKQIVKNLKPKRIKFVDQSVAKFKAFPFSSGIFLGITIPTQEYEWGIDTWFFTKEIFKERIEYHNSIKRDLSKEKRKYILDIKQEIYTKPNYKSIDLYEAVIKYNIKDVDGYIKWFKDKYNIEF